MGTSLLRALPWSVLVGTLACGDGTGEAAALDAAVPADGASSTSDASAAEPGASPSATDYESREYGGGEFHLGPVDWDETAYHNACAPETKYTARVRAAGGELLAGIWNGLGEPQAYCDACLRVDTAAGKSAVLRVVTYGDTTPNSLDVSPAAYALLDSGEYPRSMTFRFVPCTTGGAMMYEFKTGSNAWWTAFWVRNGKLPITKVEVKGASHDFTSCRRESDGSFVDDGGFGEGPFVVRVTAADGQVVEENFGWPSAGIAGAFLEGTRAFD
jgi:expansin